jgi:phosphoglycerol transferase
MGGKSRGRSRLLKAPAGTLEQPLDSEPRAVAARLPPWLPVLAGDAAVVVLLLLSTTLAWCEANARWTLSDWNQPTAYLQGDKTDVLWTLAGMKAGADGQLLPLLWKQVKDLGAPDGANWSDWPSIEEPQAAFLELLAKVLGVFAGLNVGLLIGHLLAAATFYAVCRVSDCNRLWSAGAGLAFGIAPYAFAQSPHHINCEYTWHIPLFLLVWKWVSTEPGLTPGTPRFWWAVGIGFLAGVQNVYYTNILCQLTLIGAAVVYCRNHSLRALLSACAVVAAAASAFALMNVDTWSYRFSHGPNTAAVEREYRWLELYGLKLVDLVIPPVTHRWQTLADFAVAHRAATPLNDEGSYLGIVGLAALALLVGRAVFGVVRGRTPAVPLEAWQVLWILICFSTGGLNTVLGALGFTLFRAGCRYSIVILAIVLLHAAQRLTALQIQREQKDRDRSSLMFSLAVAAALCLLIFLDQVPRPPSAAQKAAIARQVESDREFVAKIEAALPRDAMVFQLPIMRFPESPGAGLPSYDHFRAYLYSKNLRFSFGSMKGREREKWQLELLSLSFDEALKAIRDRGFAAIYLNRKGFSDRGKAIEDRLINMGDAPPITDASGDLACILLKQP